MKNEKEKENKKENEKGKEKDKEKPKTQTQKFTGLRVIQLTVDKGIVEYVI